MMQCRKDETDIGEAKVRFTAPDSITSYIFSGVSMSDCHGLGLSDIKPKLTVFLPFFIQMVLPHHVKRGEVLMQDIVIFSYLPKNQSVTVSVKRNDKQFEVLEPKLDGWTGENRFESANFDFSVLIWFQFPPPNIRKSLSRFPTNPKA